MVSSRVWLTIARKPARGKCTYTSSRRRTKRSATNAPRRHRKHRQMQRRIADGLVRDQRIRSTACVNGRNCTMPYSTGGSDDTR